MLLRCSSRKLQFLQADPFTLITDKGHYSERIFLWEHVLIVFASARFNHVELLDDIEDHWDSSTHQKERDECIHRFQEHAKLHHHRVSFISGDVHCAQVGRLYTAPKVIFSSKCCQEGSHMYQIDILMVSQKQHMLLIF